MNVQVLIDSIVRQVTVLIAQLATSGGVRAPLAQVANQVFVELARELEAQGVSRKVSADMFGMALRAYVRKVRRLAESESAPQQTLWQAVLLFIKKEGLVTRQRLLARFERDGELAVVSILRDLNDSGLVFCSGSGLASVYRAATDEELGRFSALTSEHGLDELAWVLIFRQGPMPVESLAEQLSLSLEETERCLTRLVEGGRVQREGGLLSAREFVIPLGSPIGWEASVFDHVQAMVQTISQRLQETAHGAVPSGEVGGSTFTFDVWPGHPHYQEVKGALACHRERLQLLRKKVEVHNWEHGRATLFEEVVAYVGQCVRIRDGELTDVDAES